MRIHRFLSDRPTDPIIIVNDFIVITSFCIAPGDVILRNVVVRKKMVIYPEGTFRLRQFY